MRLLVAFYFYEVEELAYMTTDRNSTGLKLCKALVVPRTPANTILS